jgi:hypothetical protein
MTRVIYLTSAWLGLVSCAFVGEMGPWCATAYANASAATSCSGRARSPWALASDEREGDRANRGCQRMVVSGAPPLKNQRESSDGAYCRDTFGLGI